MRKKALKQLYPNRGKIYEILRSKNYLKEITDFAGHNIVLNLAKHILFQKPYKNDYYQNELLRATRYGKGVE